jgi:hypothetical protein
MTFQPPASGLSNAAEYVTSGLPWLSSSAIPSGSTWTITFPYVTNHLLIRNVGTTTSTLALGFTFSGSLNTNRFLISTNSTIQGEFNQHTRVTTIYLTATTNNVTASVFAGLTTINPRTFPTLTGSTSVAFDISGTYYENNLTYTGLG